MNLKSHYDNLIVFDLFFSKAFSVCCRIRGLDPSKYRIVYDYSQCSSFGLFVFPNKILFFVNTLSCMGKDLNANKTFIVHVILHELFHSTQKITSDCSTYSIEQAVDILAVEHMRMYRSILERELDFVIDDEVLEVNVCQYKNMDYTYNRYDMKYMYKNLLIMLTNNKIDCEKVLNNANLSIIFNDIKKNINGTFPIIVRGEFIEPGPILNFMGNTMLQYNNLKYEIKILKETIIYDILDYKIIPIEFVKQKREG